MSYADELFIQNCKDILAHGVWDTDQDVRPRWEDGTPAHTVKKFCIVNRYDLREEFPVQTIRKMAFKSSVDELLWIWQKKSNNIHDLNSHIWDAWACPSTKREIVVVEPRNKVKYKQLPDVSIPVDESCLSLPRINSNHYGEFVITGKSGTRRDIVFLRTGHKANVAQSQTVFGDVKDYYARTVCGVGYYGDYKDKEIQNYFGKYFDAWVRRWENMIRRCNGSYSGDGNWYADVFVDPYFHSCENFLRWVMEHNPYKEKDALDYLQIDKDYYGAKCYSPDTCTLLTPKQNTDLNCKEWYEYKGKVYFGKRDLASALSDSFPKMLHPSGKYYEKYLEWFIKTGVQTGDLKIIPLKNSDGTLNRFPLDPEYTILKSYGYQLGVKHIYPEGEFDQVDRVLYDLKHNPASRRIMTNLYNHHDLHEMALYPCAYSMTFNVSGKTLNAILNQRSQDMLTANGWNVMQYAALVHMMAQVSGLEAGELVHVIADAHIYDRHVPVVEEIISRAPYEAPRLWMDPSVTDFYAFTRDSVRLEGYQFHTLDQPIPVAV